MDLDAEIKANRERAAQTPGTEEYLLAHGSQEEIDSYLANMDAARMAFETVSQKLGELITTLKTEGPKLTESYRETAASQLYTLSTKLRYHELFRRKEEDNE